MPDLLTVTARVVEADGLYRAEVAVRRGERDGSRTTLSQPTARLESAYKDMARIVIEAIGSEALRVMDLEIGEWSE